MKKTTTEKVEFSLVIFLLTMAVIIMLSGVMYLLSSFIVFEFWHINWAAVRTLFAGSLVVSLFISTLAFNFMSN